MEAKVRFKNKISEPLLTATDFAIKTKKKKGKEFHYLEFTVCKSMGVSKTYTFDSHDKVLLEKLLENIKAKGEFLFDEDCGACEQTISCTEMDYDKYIEMTKCGELKGELKFAGGDYVITV
jgi:hypothetical protein